MKRWTLIVLSLGMTLAFSQSGLMAKGGRGQGDGLQRGHGTGSSVYAQNSHGNGQGTVDRDLGKDRATEVGRGKKKGLHKDQYSIGDGNDKVHDSGSHKKDKDKVKTQHKDKKDKKDKD
jgi:hypothetical protein